ncbi:PREDICTED: uncharacterized protein LOC106106811 [Papilio polytes]|uniref:uncharacterized protein LOC106106811 n=1 Tax=Papilio polytes TaxID=76194 RepID=UPI0006768CD7|nr:PREDICTED: uncharacterized protein LOC106106811 [Papilio polytes]
MGRWSEKDCQYGLRRQTCSYGQIIWQGCRQCRCNSIGELHCTDIYCTDKQSTARREISTIGNRCIPLKYYRANCSICFCPASGLISEARCTVDSSCLSTNQQQSRSFTTIDDTNCIPNVMYVFPCLQCLCSEDGKFLLEKCFEVCQAQTQLKLNPQCKPGSYYRRNCNVCQCSQNRIQDDKLCTNISCGVNTPSSNLVSLRNMRKKCVPYTFTQPICLFCDCNSNGTINEDSCLLTDCSTNLELKSANYSGQCNADEVVPVCVECFCLQNGSTDGKYCSRACNYQSKFKVLERVLTESIQTQNLIKKSDLKIIPSHSCKPNSVYFDEGKYCICSTSATNLKLCKSFNDTKPFRTLPDNQINYNVDMPCQPNTFVDFDCNSCYCSKKGKIDPKWCTYDDCNAKRLIQESHKRPNLFTADTLSEACTPGSISKDKCNFCICPESGLSKEKACTKNYCSDTDKNQNNVRFTCEPLAYYEVDCNVCYCPSDGLKNVAKCTKNLCEKSYLRSDSCSSGQLFSEMCNVCLCPPNGNKNDRVCTNHTCPEVASWPSFELSENLLEDRLTSDTKRSLDLCFPGEQFIDGCKQCVCPEMGLKMYAECDVSQCTEKHQMPSETELQNTLLGKGGRHFRIRRDMPCYHYNQTEPQKECTPGSMYIIKCQMCICPYMGSIMHFCRPLKNMYCEQPFPNVFYEPMGRRHTNDSSEASTIETTTVVPTHNHTKYQCDKVGHIMDSCYICECEENHQLIEEHCFKNEGDNCTDVRPSFLMGNKALVGNVIRVRSFAQPQGHATIVSPPLCFKAHPETCLKQGSN